MATRIVRGLYYHHFQKFIPLPWSVDAWCTDGFPQQAKGLSDVKGIINDILREVPVVKAGGAFKYWFKVVGEPEDLSSAWYLLFFSRVAFFGMTAKDAGRPGVDAPKA